MVYLTAAEIRKHNVTPTDLLDGTLSPLAATLSQNTVKKGAKVLVQCGQLSLPKGSKARPCYWDANFVTFKKTRTLCGVQVSSPHNGELYIVQPHLVLPHPPKDLESFFVLAPDIEVHSDYECGEDEAADGASNIKSKSTRSVSQEKIDELAEKAWSGEDVCSQLEDLTAVSLLAFAKKIGLPVTGRGKTRQDYLNSLTKTLKNSNLGEKLFSPEPQCTFTPVTLPGLFLILGALLCKY